MIKDSSSVLKRIHIAILSKKWKLLEKIISGKKTIESRWYVNRVSPWNKINRGDTVYFKDSGEPVTCKASVSKVLQFENITKEKIIEILKAYGNKIGLKVPANKDELPSFYNKKRYCILIFLENIKTIEPFSIDKTGFGINSAWLIVDNIDKIKKPR
jgi:ASC-1-like (ASCH) protein